MDKRFIKKQFRNYVSTFNIKDKMIKMKYYHSLRVMELCNDIAISLKLKNSDIEISIIIGLLHDYARFPQWTKYKTFSDLDSIDHANEGVKLLFNDCFINSFYLNKKNYKIIKNAIKYHNKYKCPSSLKDDIHCKIIRDADKIDILNIVSSKKKQYINVEKISRKIKKDFFNKKTVKRLDLVNNDDIFVFNLAMVFDLNYKYSYQFIKKNNYLDVMLENIINKEDCREYIDFVKKYIDERIG